MIKPSIRRAEAAIDLVAQGLGCGFVDFLAARQIIHVEEGVAEADVVDRVAVVVEQDLAGEAGVELDVDLWIDGRVNGLLFLSSKNVL
jgi:hypothetical protein